MPAGELPRVVQEIFNNGIEHLPVAPGF
jgi:hypothetical protein